MRFAPLIAVLLSSSIVVAQSAVRAASGVGATHGSPAKHLWSQASTWPSGAPPVDGECATIAPNDTVYLDVSTAKLGGLDVQGRLVFINSDLALTADWIRVGGSLEIGSSSFPFQNRATITLTDSYTCDPTKTNRTLSVEGSGVLSMHGRVESPAWLHLAQTAPAGAQQIVLESAPAWRVGESIAIASTDFDAHQAEERTISAIAGNTLTLSQPLDFTHWGSIEAQYVDGVGVDERAEVGLLSRRIVVQSVVQIDAQGRRLGGSVVVRAPAATAPKFEVEWVEFRELGDEGLDGRFALFFKSIGDVSGSYLANSSIHHTFNHAVQVLSTQNLALIENVDFDTVGSAFSMSYGGVTGSIWQSNLAILTRASTPGFEVSPGDATPASFWLTHPNNSIDGNVAAGSDAFGFFSDVADGETAPPASFDSDVAHSNGDSGFWQDKRPSPASTALYSNFATYKNRRYGAWMRSYGSSEIAGLRAADNRAGLYPASEGIQNDFTELTGIASIHVHDSLFVGESNNVGTPTSIEELAVGRSLPQSVANPAPSMLPEWDALCGVELYDGMLTLDHLAFANFVDVSVPGVFERKAGAFHQAQHNSPWAVDPRNHAAQIAFVNARPVWFRTPQGIWATNPTVGDNGIANTLLVDDDGSVTGSPASVVLPDNPFLVPSSATTFDPNWNAWVTSAAPSTPYAQLELMNWSPQLTGTPGPMSLSLRSVARNAQIELVQPIFGAAQTVTDRFTSNVLTDEEYAYDYDAATPLSDWSTVFTLSIQFSEPNRFVLASIPMPPIDGGWAQLDGVFLPSSSTLQELQSSSTSSYFFDASTQRVWLKLFTRSNGVGSSVFDGERSTLAVIAY